MTEKFKLGDKVTFTGTVEKVKSRATQKFTYQEVGLPGFPTWKQNPDGTWGNGLNTLNTGVIVGKRTIQDSAWGYDENYVYVQPVRGTARQVYLVAYHMRRKPVMCYEEQLDFQRTLSLSESI